MPTDLPPSTSGKSPLEVARLCAQEAGRIVMAGFGREQEVRVKGRGNLVTAADLASERAIQEILAAEYPDHSILSEETAATARSDGWLWVVDPLDGTHNYARGVPIFCINIALCYGEEPLLALTYEPVRREEFRAQKGEGAFANGEPMRASARGSVRESVLAVDLGYDDRRAARLLSLVKELWPGMQSVRIMGSAALGLAYAACGRFDLFAHHMLYPWDVAAGILLVREASGAISDRDGEPVGIRSEGVVAGAPGAHADFLRLAAGRRWRD
ncbi:MAG: inositol monophosphatase family protein [Chloroflexota bacterium]|nr:inositol monophosphatase family protein [Chloroflexota bacterium]